MTPRPLLLSEARQAADYLARAEAWVDQVAPELRADIARSSAFGSSPAPCPKQSPGTCGTRSPFRRVIGAEVDRD